MGKKKWIDKKTATTFTLVHRSQNDPLIHDDEAPSMVFKEVAEGNSKGAAGVGHDKIKTTKDLESELGESAIKRRANEGEAAMYGVYYDDTEYDYMQHLRDIGTSSDAVLIDAVQPKKEKGKQIRLEDALRDAPEQQVEVAGKDGKFLLPADVLPSEQVVKRTYQDQQDIPDVLAGFQPDMDPRLREVLEALEDDAYVDDDEDIFEELAKGGAVEAGDLDEDFFDDNDDEGWDSDATEKPANDYKPSPTSNATAPPAAGPAQEAGGEDWMQEFHKFKKAQKKSARFADASEVASSIGDISFGGESNYTSSRRRRREKKGGAATESTGYSMTSSSLFRTEGLTLLDDRFDKIEALYAADSDEEEDSGNFDDAASQISTSTTNTTGTTASRSNKPFVETRSDFNQIMDDFLENYSLGKKGRVKRSKEQTGMEQLDEIRRELGKARISTGRTGGGGGGRR